MKQWIGLALLFCLILIACSSPEAVQEATPSTAGTPSENTQHQIETAIAANQTEMAIKTQTAPTSTPSGGVPLTDISLTGAELNELANRWPETPLDNTPNLDTPYCELDCLSWIWRGLDAASELKIELYRLDARDSAASAFVDFQNTLGSNGTEMSLPDLVSLPEQTLLLDDRDNTNMFMLVTRQGAAILVLSLSMPDLADDQNILFLSLYADRQIQKLIQFGYK